MAKIRRVNDGSTARPIAMYLDAVRERYGLRTDYQLSRFLGIVQSRLIGYRAGNHGPDDVMCIQLARLLDIPAGRVLATMAAERNRKAGINEAVSEWLAVAAICVSQEEVLRAAADRLSAKTIQPPRITQSKAARNAAHTR